MPLAAEFCVRIADSHSESDVAQAVKIIKEAFLQHPITRKDRDTITQEELKQSLSIGNSELLLLEHSSSGPIGLAILHIFFLTNDILISFQS